MGSWTFQIFFFHVFAFATYVFTLTYDTFYLPISPDRQTYGGRFKYLTFWNEVGKLAPNHYQSPMSKTRPGSHNMQLSIMLNAILTGGYIPSNRATGRAATLPKLAGPLPVFFIKPGSGCLDPVFSWLSQLLSLPKIEKKHVAFDGVYEYLTLTISFHYAVVKDCYWEEVNVLLKKLA
jgi:hypothetical protein